MPLTICLLPVAGAACATRRFRRGSASCFMLHCSCRHSCCQRVQPRPTQRKPATPAPAEHGRFWNLSTPQRSSMVCIPIQAACCLDHLLIICYRPEHMGTTCSRLPSRDATSLAVGVEFTAETCCQAGVDTASIRELLQGARAGCWQRTLAACQQSAATARSSPGVPGTRPRPGWRRLRRRCRRPRYSRIGCVACRR